MTLQGLLPCIIILLVALGKSAELTTHGSDEAIPETGIRFVTSPNVPRNMRLEDFVPTINIALHDLGAPDGSESKPDITTHRLRKENSSRSLMTDDAS